MTAEEALKEHELDVAALELDTPRKQFENLKKWASKIDVEEDKKYVAILLKTFSKRYGIRDL